MACTISHEAYEQLLGEAHDFSETVRNIGNGFATMAPMTASRIARHWDISEFQLAIPALPLVSIWVPIAASISAYHRISLPTWLTFGHPIGFGGVLPNVCCEMDKVMQGGEGDYPCLPYEFKIWLAKVVGPKG